MPEESAESTRQTCADLEAARKAASFSTDELSIVYARSKQVRDTRRWMISLLKEDSAFARGPRTFMSRTERFRNSYDQALAYFKIRNKHGLAKIERDQLRIYIDDYLPVWLHDSMAYSTVQSQASKHQLEDLGWEANMRDGRWIGCYAQTEIRHGSNLSQLQTTATLDLDTDEWVIHTPDPADAKFWIGGLGKTATHAIVQAKLIIKGKDHGMHPLLIQIRDLQSHKVLPNLEIHDAGPKLGSEANDNGYMRFFHYRAPRTALLMKNVDVSRDGTYKYLNPSARILARGTMSLVRVFLVDLAIHNLSRALTIAIRYSFVRRQGSSKTGSNSLEPRIAEYKSIQLRTLPWLAEVFPLLFASFFLRDLYNAQQDHMRADPFSKDTADRLAELHAWSSGLKAYATAVALDGCNSCKEACGGIGYHKFAGFQFVLTHPAAGVIIEGENWVLHGETTKYLVRALSQSKSPFTAYLTDTQTADHWTATTPADLRDPAVQRHLLQLRARHLVRTAKRRANPHIDHGDAFAASRAHTQLLVHTLFHRHLSTLSTLSPATHTVLRKLGDLAFVSQALTCLGECYPVFARGDEGGRQADLLRDVRDNLLGEVSTEAVGVVDAFDLDDWYLDSAIGNAKGDIYNQLYTRIRQEPLNIIGKGIDQNGVVIGWHDTLQQVVDGKIGHFTERTSKL
ncbi:hypothetical protein PYCC9005_005990 [Savitreella phatthalungensis]